MTETAETAAAARPRWKRDTGVFLGGQTVSMFGSMLVQYAIMWYLTLETESGAVLALSIVFGMLPQAVVSVFGGVWADRLNRKMLIIAADASIAVTTLALALLMLAGVTDLWLIFLTLAIRSVGAGIQQPAVMALIPQIVPTEQLIRVNGIFQSIQSGIMLLAPAIAAAVLAQFDIVGIFFVDVVTAAIGIGLLALIAVPTIRTAASAGQGYFADLAAGVRYTFSHRLVRWLLVLFALIFLLTVAPSMLTPLMVVRTFGPEEWKLAANEIAFSIGMMGGGVLIATWGGFRNRVVTMLVASLGFGAFTVALGFSSNLWVFLVFMLLVGFAVPFFSTPATTLLQERVEPEFQGRVFSFVGIVMAVAAPIGMIVMGPLADVVSVESLLVVAGALTFVVLAVAALLPSGRAAIAEAGPRPDDAADPAADGAAPAAASEPAPAAD